MISRVGDARVLTAHDRRGPFSETYGNMYGMVKTTVYLPRPLKAALARAARNAGSSEAELIRRAIEQLTHAAAAPRPRIPLFRSNAPDLAERVEQALDGFGDD